LSKIEPLNDVASLANEQSVVGAINDNNDKIEAAFDNTLSRDGSTPNQMESNLDMNSNRILNLPAPINLTDPVRLQDVADGVEVTVIQGGLTVSSFIATLLDDDNAGVAKATLEIPTISSFAATLLDDSDAATARSTLGLRTSLEGSTTFFVRTDGNDNNSGLVNDSSGAFLTIQRAINEIRANVDTKLQTPVIKIADGTYTTGAEIIVEPEVHPFILEGNTTTPANVLLNYTGTDFAYQQYGSRVEMRGMKLQAPNGSIIKHDHGRLIITGNSTPVGSPLVIFGAGSIQIRVSKQAYLDSGGHTVDAGGSEHISVDRGATARILGDIVVTGTPNFTNAFVSVQGGGNLLFYADVSGAYTGTPYILASGGLIKTYEGSNPALAYPNHDTFFGNSGGTIGTGSTFDDLLGTPAFVGAQTIDNSDLDNLVVSGFFFGGNLTNSPDGTADDWTIRVITNRFSTDNLEQFATKAELPPYEAWFRRKQSGVWQAWARISPPYEEGSWTPVLTFGGSAAGVTYSTQVGRYIKIGNVVHCWGTLVLTSNGSGVGLVLITDFPFLTSNITGLSFVGPCQLLAAGTISGDTHIRMTNNSNDSVIAQGVTGNAVNLTDTQIDDDTTLSFQITYRTG
jgi:hypothetical protein